MCLEKGKIHPFFLDIMFSSFHSSVNECNELPLPPPQLRMATPMTPNPDAVAFVLSLQEQEDRVDWALHMQINGPLIHSLTALNAVKWWYDTAAIFVSWSTAIRRSCRPLYFSIHQRRVRSIVSIVLRHPHGPLRLSLSLSLSLCVRTVAATSTFGWWPVNPITELIDHFFSAG